MSSWSLLEMKTSPSLAKFDSHSRSSGRSTLQVGWLIDSLIYIIQPVGGDLMTLFKHGHVP